MSNGCEVIFFYWLLCRFNGFAVGKRWCGLRLRRGSAAVNLGFYIRIARVASGGWWPSLLSATLHRFALAACTRPLYCVCKKPSASSRFSPLLRSVPLVAYCYSTCFIALPAPFYVSGLCSLPAASVVRCCGSLRGGCGRP